MQIVQASIKPLPGFEFAAQGGQALHGCLGVAAISIKIRGQALRFKLFYLVFFSSQVKDAPSFHERAAAIIQYVLLTHSLCVFSFNFSCIISVACDDS